MDEIEKKKKTPPRDPRLKQGERAVWAALGVCLLIVVLTYIARFMDMEPPLPPLIYSVGLWLKVFRVFWVILGIAAVLFLGLLGFALWHGVRPGCVTLAFFGAVVLTPIILYFSPLSMRVVPVQALSYQDHMYRLLYAHDADLIYYEVIECDSLGVLCRHYATPLMGFGDSYGDIYDLNRLGDAGRLIVNGSDQKLYLQGNDLTFPMKRFCGVVYESSTCQHRE